MAYDDGSVHRPRVGPFRLFFSPTKAVSQRTSTSKTATAYVCAPTGPRSAGRSSTRIFAFAESSLGGCTGHEEDTDPCAARTARAARSAEAGARGPRAHAEQRGRIIAGKLELGDVASLRRFVGLTQGQFAEALGTSGAHPAELGARPRHARRARARAAPDCRVRPEHDPQEPRIGGVTTPPKALGSPMRSTAPQGALSAHSGSSGTA